MNPQDFKAFLKVLERIADSLEDATYALEETAGIRRNPPPECDFCEKYIKHHVPGIIVPDHDCISEKRKWPPNLKVPLK